jgi:hypothetical protein
VLPQGCCTSHAWAIFSTALTVESGIKPLTVYRHSPFRSFWR